MIRASMVVCVGLFGSLDFFRNSISIKTRAFSIGSSPPKSPMASGYVDLGGLDPIEKSSNFDSKASFERSPLSAHDIIRAKIVEQNVVSFHLSVDFTKKYVKESFRLVYPQGIDLNKLPASIVDIPLITNVIAVIWLSGGEYTIEEMDEDLYYSLRIIKAFFKRFFYNTPWEGELVPQRLIKNSLPNRTSRAAALFTGGLDSTTTLFRHWDENLTLISFNEPHQTAATFAKTNHLDFYTISMNFDSFLRLTRLDRISPDITKWFWDTSMGLSWVGAAAPFLYAMGIQRLYIPSGFTWRSFLFPDGETMRQPASPLIDENISPAGLQVRHDVFTMTRTDKIRFISTFCAENNLPKPQLVVCNHHRKRDLAYSHCNECMKCLVTMLDILAIGENWQDYGFTLSEHQFIPRFQAFITHSPLRRSGTYAACYDTQQYLKRHLDTLPQAHLGFYHWFMALDLFAMLEKSAGRPPRPTPFSWNDYEDLYPGVKNFIDIEANR